MKHNNKLVLAIYYAIYGKYDYRVLFHIYVQGLPLPVYAVIEGEKYAIHWDFFRITRETRSESWTHPGFSRELFLSMCT